MTSVISEITVQELAALRKDKVDFFLLDVRNADEYKICHLEGHLIPFTELPKRLHELNREQPIIVHCHGGGRSARATLFLMQQGFKNVSNLRGGIMAWANEIDTSMQKY